MRKLCLLTFLFFGFSLNLISQTVPTSGLIAWYPFNGNANDQSGNSLNGTVNGAALTTDRFGNPNSAYDFDGLNDFIELAHSQLINFGPNDDFTISVWVLPQTQLGSGNVVDIIGKWEDFPGGSNTSYPFAIRMRRTPPIGNLQMLRLDQSCSNFPILLSNGSIIDNDWHNLIYLKDGNILKMYIDGTLINQTTDVTSCVTGNTLPTYIGKRGGTLNPSHYRGKIDDILVYDRALTPCEINSINGLDLNSDLVVHYPFDGNFLDVSGNNNNANNQGASFAPDRNGNPSSSASFDGVNDLITRNSIIDVSSQSGMSFSAWFYPEPPVNSQINRYSGISIGTKMTGELALRETTSSLKLFQGVLADGNPLSTNGNNTSALANSVPYNYNNWYHVVSTYQDQKVRIYVNGQFISENTGFNGVGGLLSNVPANSNLFIGTSFGTNNDQKFYRGRLDDVRIYNRILNDCEIVELFQPGSVVSNVSTVQACRSDTLSLSTSLDSAYWTDNQGNFLGSGSNLDFQITNQTFILATGFNFCGCLQTDTFNIQLKAQPNYTLPDTILVCPDVFDTISILAGPSTTVLWSQGSLFVDSTSNSPVVNPIFNPDTFPIYQTVYIQASNQNSGCIVKDSAVLEVAKRPTYTFFNSDFLCSSDTVEFLNIQNSGSNWTSISWSSTGGNGLSFVNSPPRLISNNLTANSYNVELRLRIIDPNGCYFYDTTNFIQFRRINIDAGEDTLLCLSDTVLLGSDFDFGYSFHWVPSIYLNDSTLPRPEFFYPDSTNSPMNFTYQLIKQHTASQCLANDLIDLTINKDINVFAGNDTLLCSQQEIQIGENLQPGFTYSWLGSDSVNSTLISNPLFSYLNPDTSVRSVQMVITATETLTGCKVSDSVNILIKPQIFLEAGQNLLFCGSDSTGIGRTLDSRYSYQWSPGNGLENANSDTTVISLDNFSDSLQNFEYFLTASFDGCSARDSIEILVNPKPFDQLSGPNVVCPGVDTADYFSGRSFSDYTYNWFVDGGSIGNNFNDSITVSWDSTNFNAFVGLYPVNSFGCVGDTFIWNVRINPLLIPEIDIDTLRICERDKGNVIYKIKYPVTNSAYTWSIDNGQILNGQGSDEVAIEWNGPGFGKIWVSEENITNLDSCFGISDTLDIEIIEDPLLDSIYGPLDVCDFGDTLLFTANNSLNGTFFWSSDSISQILSGQGSDSILITTNLDGDFTINTYLLSNEGCFSDTLTQTVNIRYLQKPEIEIDTTVFCYDDSLLIDLQIAKVFQNSNYLWTSSAGQIIGQGSDHIQLLVSQADTIQIIVEELNSISIDTCFTLSDTLEFIVHPYPVASQIIGDFDICDFKDSLIYLVDGNSNSTFYWSSGVLSQILGNNSIDSILLVFSGDGDVPLEVYEENIYGCFGDTLRDTINVRYFQRPEILTDTNKICFWDSTDFIFRIKDKYDSSIYQWTSNQGQIVQGQGESLMRLRVYQADTIQVYVSELNSAVEDTCYGISDTIEVYFYPRPERELSIIGPDTLCFSQECTWYRYPGWDNSTFYWSTSAGVCNMLVSYDSIELGFSNVGSYFLNIVETSEYGCIGDTVDFGIEIFPNPETTISFNDSIICPTDRNDRFYQANGFDFSEYQWIINGGVINYGQGSDIISVDWGNNSQPSLSVFEKTFAECTNDTLDFPLLVDDMSADIFNVTFDSAFQEMQINGDAVLLEFNENDKLILLAGEEEPSFLSSKTLEEGVEQFIIDSVFGERLIFYQFVSINACNDSLYSDLHNNILLEGKAEENSNVFNLDWSEYLAWDRDVDYKLYEYQAGDDILIETTSEDNYLFQNERTDFVQCFYVIGENQNNPELISRSNLLCFEFPRKIKIPDVVTANGDGFNDKFEIENIDLYPEHELLIFNRSGRPVLKTNSYTNTWPPDDLNSGVYYYRFRILGSNQAEFAGYIHLMR